MQNQLKEESERLQIMLTDKMPPQLLQQIDAGNVVLPREFEEATVLYADIPSFYNVLQGI